MTIPVYPTAYFATSSVVFLPPMSCLLLWWVQPILQPECRYTTKLASVRRHKRQSERKGMSRQKDIIWTDHHPLGFQPDADTAAFSCSRGVKSEFVYLFQQKANLGQFVRCVGTFLNSDVEFVTRDC